MDLRFHDSIIYRLPVQPLKTSFTREEIIAFYSERENLEALFLASPVIHTEFLKVKEGKKVKDENKVFDTLLKYMLRMHSRCTPFGLFASCGVTQWGDDKSEMQVKREYSRSTRLDMHFSVSLAMMLAKHPEIKPGLKFYPNSSLYISGESVRYVEYSYLNKRRIHQISSVSDSPYLQRVLEASKAGKTPLELAEVIVDEEITLEDASEFIDQIIENQLLVSELEPGVTGDELTTEILTILKNLVKNHPSKKISENVEVLTDVLERIREIDGNVVNDVNTYHEISEALKKLELDFDLSKLFQTDLFMGENKQGLGWSVKKKFLKTTKLLLQLYQKPGETNLSLFKKKFHERYEEKEVPLLVALDNEMGIGYGTSMGTTSDISPLLDGIMIPYSSRGDQKLNWNNVQAYLLSKISEAQKDNKRIVELKPEELSSFKGTEDVSLSLSVMFSIIGKQEGEPKLYLGGASGTSAANLLGRFASGNEQINAIVNDITNTEEKLAGDAILAEITHLPENRVGNILMRPIFRKYEIPYLSKSNLPESNQIKLEDLMISVRRDRLIVRSKKLNREILPRMANAHNFSANALPVYHFLCDLQFDRNGEGAYFSWGALQNNFQFLPRVEIEGVIVNMACWQLKKEDIKELQVTDLKDKKKVIASWREKYGIDQVVRLTQGDNKLLINFEDEENINMFLREIRKKSAITLEEFPQSELDPFVVDESGQGYTNEFIAPLIYTQKNQSSVRFANSDECEQVQRAFSLGDEWLYYKLYCGVKTADNVLTEAIIPLADHLKKEGIIDYWFFIRYADPEKHLRIRFHFADMNRLGEAIQLFQQVISPYRDNGLIWKVQTDTYQRELERYGKNTIVQSEKLFHLDSECIVRVLDMIEGDEGEKIRWLFCIRAVDQFFDDFHYTLEGRMNLMEHLKTSFLKEFNSNKYLTKQIDKKYRESKSEILDVLNRETDAGSEIKPLFDLLNQRSEMSKPYTGQIVELAKEGKLQVHPDDLMSSYIHMHLNRLFRNKQRQHEMMVYDFLWKHYRSQFMMRKYQTA